MLDIALQYAANNWAVFPLSASKKPLKASHGLNDATTDTTTLRTLFARRGAINVAVACGPSGLVVLDADGEAGMAELRKLAPLPPTLVAQTPRGGLHVFFRAPADVEIRSSNAPRAIKGAGGLDIKAHGGYVVISPSRTNTGSYTWVSTAPIADLPASVRAYIETRGALRTAAQPLDLQLGAVPAFLNGSGASQRLASRARLTHWTAHDEARIKSALSVIPSDGYDEWLKVGMILHGLDWDRADGTNLGFEIWNDWSAKCLAKYSEAACEQKWQSFGRTNANSATLGTLFHLATQFGWRGQVVSSAQTNGAASPINGTPLTYNFNQPPINQGPLSINGASLGAPAPALPAAPASAVPFPQAPAGLGAQASAAAPAGVIFPDTTRSGAPAGTFKNAKLAIGALGITCRKDLFHEQMLVGGRLLGQWAGDLTDDAVLVLRSIIRDTYGFDAGVQNVRDAAHTLCLENPFNPVVDYLAGLQWDGTPRIGKWVVDYLGAVPSPTACEFGRLMLIAAVRRARCPGTKFDQIVVIEGPEGTGKSSAFKILAGEENFSDQHILGAADREQQEAFRGVWIHEIAELSGIRRVDVERVKAFASRTEDRARPAYARYRVDMKRRGIFVGTTNNETYLQSDTGNRRFWPITAGAIQLDALARDRDQLWAEAAAAEAGGRSIVLDRALWEAAGAEQDSRRDRDPWEDLLSVVTGKLFDVAGEKEMRISTRDLLEISLGIPATQQSTAAYKRLCHTMHRLGWRGPRLFRDGEFRGRGFFKAAR